MSEQQTEQRTHDLEIEVKPTGYVSTVDITMADVRKGTEHLVALIEAARAKVVAKMEDEGAYRVEGYQFKRDPDEDLHFSVHVSRYGLVMPSIIEEIGTIHDRIVFIE